MKAVRVVGYHQNMRMEDVAEPVLEGPLDVVVKIGAAGVCRTDLHVLEGQWEPKTGVALPYTIGHENAGWVHAVGDAVTNVKPGCVGRVGSATTCTARTPSSRASTPTAATPNTCGRPPGAA